MSVNPLLPILGQSPRRTTEIRSPLHVLTLTPFYPSNQDDTAGCFIAETLDALAKVGVVNTVFAVHPFYRPKVHSRPAAVGAQWLRYFSLPGEVGLSTAGAFLFARIVPAARELNCSHTVDLIHAHGPLPCGHAAMLLGRELNIPYVVSVHGIDDSSPVTKPDLGGKWSRRISRQVYGKSRRVICGTERVREEVLQPAARSCRTSVVYNSIDPELFSPAPELLETSPTVLSAGNLTRVEGHDFLIRAIAALAKEFPGISLEIIGDGPEGSRLQAQVRNQNLSGLVRFLGRQPRRQVAEAMKRCTLFALPSRYQGLGCVYIEAMSCGKAVIGCRGQGISEIIQHGDNGFLVGPENEKELTLAMRMLIREPQRRWTLGAAARNSILERLTIEQQAEHLRRIYQESVTPVHTHQ